MSIPFDDIDAINAHASDDYGDWGKEIVVSQEMINDFAELTGDRQWIHVDVERCLAESPFAGATIHARSRLIGAEAHRAGTLLSFESATHVKGNEKPSLVYTSQILYQG